MVWLCLWYDSVVVNLFYGVVCDLFVEWLVVNYFLFWWFVVVVGGDDDWFVLVWWFVGWDFCWYVDGLCFGESCDCGNLFFWLFVFVVSGGDGFWFGGVVGVDFY